MSESIMREMDISTLLGWHKPASNMRLLAFNLSCSNPFSFPTTKSRNMYYVYPDPESTQVKF
jgi:hypothetical protein